MRNNGLMTIVAVIVLGIIGFMVADHYTKPQTTGEKIQGSVHEVAEEIKDEIDDHTTAR